MTQPHVRRNDWSSLAVPRLGAWEPTLSVSVVIPAFRAERLLPYVLAALAAQSYPEPLLEVVVVDDGGTPPLTLPPVRPERTRVVRTEPGWGRAATCATGARLAEGDVLHWLDSDMLVERDEIEAQLRWHHLIDYAVVLGDKLFVDPAELLRDTPAEVRSAVDEGRTAAYFQGQQPDPHDWVEEMYSRTDDLRAAGPRAHRAHVGATASLRRALYLEAGGMDTELRLGEDSELGYRLGECGAVFVPDRQARSWHLGRTHVMRRQHEVNDYNLPFLANRVPDMRAKRLANGRRYAVPCLEVLLEVAGQPHRSVIETVDAVLASSLPDLEVVLVGPWDELDDRRVAPLDDPQLGPRLIHAHYADDPRVRLVPTAPSGRCRAMFRMTLPSARWSPDQRAFSRLLRDVELTHHGLRMVLMPDGQVVRLERTAAVERARRIATPGATMDQLDDLVDELFGSWWVAGSESGFRLSGEVRLARLPGNAGPAHDPAQLPPYRSGDAAPSGAATPPEHPPTGSWQRLRDPARALARRLRRGWSGRG